MRASCLTCVVGIALACSGEPFSAAADAESQPSSASAGSSGSLPAPSTAKGGAGAVGGSAPSQQSAGDSARSGAPEPEAGGDASSLAGASAGGEGGAASATPECHSAALNGWELGYFPELREPTTHESHPFFQIVNRGQATTLDRIAIRYYFSKESDLAETPACYWVTGDHCSLAKIDFHDAEVPSATASRYLEVSFPGASKVTVAAESLEVRVGFKTGSAALIQTNDYSFDANAGAPSSLAPFPYKRWPRATLYLDGELVWGVEPCASNSDPRVL